MKRKLTDEEVTAIIKSDKFQKEHRESVKGFLSMYKTNWTPLPDASAAADKFKHVEPNLTKPWPG